MTMFMHDLSATEGKIPDLLHKITNSPGGDFDIVLESLAAMFPFLLRLPSPIKNWATMLRTELSVIAREVWGGKEHVSMHAKLLDSLASQDVTESEAVAQASCFFCHTRLDLLIRLSDHHHPIRRIRDYS